MNKWGKKLKAKAKGHMPIKLKITFLHLKTLLKDVFHSLTIQLELIKDMLLFWKPNIL